MNFTALLDVAIGLSLVILGASLFVTILNEFIAQALNSRGKQLAASLAQLLELGDLRLSLRQSPLLRDLLLPGQTAQSYVDPTTLARTLIGWIVSDRPAATVAEFQSSLQLLPESRVKFVLAGLASSAGASMADLEKAVAAWINSSLEQLGETYKRHMQNITLLIGILVAVAFNIDTIELTKRLYSDHGLRTQLAQYAENFVGKVGDSDAKLKACLAAPGADNKTPLDQPDCAAIKELVDAIRGGANPLALPIGWKSWSETLKLTPVQWSTATDGTIAFRADVANWLLALAGWLLTGLAVSLGAPFWFDLLRKFVNIRHSMRKPTVS